MSLSGNNRLMVFLSLLFMLASSGCIDFMEAVCKDPQGVDENLLCVAAKIDRRLSGNGVDDVDDSCDDRCLRDRGVETMDSIHCGKIKSQALKNDCYFQISLGQKNARLCDQITDSIKKDDCRYQIGMSTGFSGTCDGIENQNQKDECYYNSASKSRDNSVCAKISSEWLRNKCAAEFTTEVMDPEKCRGLPPGSSSGCWNNLINRAVETNDIDLCKKMPYELYMYPCINNIAVKTRDVELCNNFQNDFELQMGCIQNYYWKTGVPELSDCEGMQSEGYKFGCFSMIAADQNDASYCENLKSKDSKECVDLLLKNKKDPVACYNVMGTDLMDYCFERAAEECDKITDEVQQAECWVKIFGDDFLE